MTQCGRFWGIELVWNVIRLLVPPPNRWQVSLALQPVWRGFGVGGGGVGGRRWGGETDDVTFLACIEWHLEYQPFERCCVHFCIMPDGAYQRSEPAGGTQVILKVKYWSFLEIFPNTHHCRVHQLRRDWSVWILVINRVIIFTLGPVWPASSNKWKVL